VIATTSWPLNTSPVLNDLIVHDGEMPPGNPTMALSARAASGVSTPRRRRAGASGGRTATEGKGVARERAAGESADRGRRPRAERALDETLGRRRQLDSGHAKARVDLVDRPAPQATSRRPAGGSRLEAKVSRMPRSASIRAGQLADLRYGATPWIACHDFSHCG